MTGDADFASAGYVRTGEDSSTYNDGEVSSMTYYSKPVITQTQKIESKPVVTRKMIT